MEGTPRTRMTLIGAACLFALMSGSGGAGAAGTSRGPAQESKAKWISLFDGKSLAGWTPKIRGSKLGENFANTFRVEDGVIKVRYDKYPTKDGKPQFDGRFGHLFYKTPYSRYRLRLEYRFVGEQCAGGPGWAVRNSGAMLHCQAPETMGIDQDFPVSIEVQILGGDGIHERHTVNLCTPGTNVVMNGELITRHCTDSTSPTFHGDQWVTVEVEIRGPGNVRHFVGDKVVLEYEKSQYDPRDADAKKLIKGDDLYIRGGYISLQSESHPVEFRKVELLDLSKPSS